MVFIYLLSNILKLLVALKPSSIVGDKISSRTGKFLVSITHNFFFFFWGYTWKCSGLTCLCTQETLLTGYGG